jgi:hypothetical protein
MRTIYMPVDSDLLEHGRYYWCTNWGGRTEPFIVSACRVEWQRGPAWVISTGNEHTEHHYFDNPEVESDSHALKLVGPIPVPDNLI